MSNGVFDSWFEMGINTTVVKTGSELFPRFAMDVANPGSGALITYNYLRDGVFDSGDGVFDLASTGMHIHIAFCTKNKGI